jgi:CheY-like chemotaxis protein
MPVMDGHEAIRRIRAMAGGEDTKIIAVTASAMDENRQELMRIGADDFISKGTAMNYFQLSKSFSSWTPATVV